MGTRTIQWAPTKRKPSTQNQKCCDLLVFGRDVFQDLGNAQLLCLTNTRCKTWQTQGLHATWQTKGVKRDKHKMYITNTRCTNNLTNTIHTTWQTQDVRATWQTQSIYSKFEPNPDLFSAWAWTLVGNQGKKEPSHPWSRAAVFASGWKGYQVVTNTNEVQSRLISEANIQTRIGQHHTQQSTTSLSQWVLLHGFGPPVILQCPPWRFNRNGSLIDVLTLQKWGRNWLLSTCIQVTGTRQIELRKKQQKRRHRFSKLNMCLLLFICAFLKPKASISTTKIKNLAQANSLHWPAFTNLKAMEQVMSSMRQGYRQQQHPPPPSSTALSTWISKTMRSKIGAKKIRLPNHWGTAHLAQRNCLLEYDVTWVTGFKKLASSTDVEKDNVELGCMDLEK